MSPHLTVLQRTNIDGFPKAGELIEISGAHELEASDRAVLNLLYQHAHESGRLAACRTYAHRRFMLESQRRFAPSPDAANEQLPPHRSPNRLPDAAVYR